MRSFSGYVAPVRREDRVKVIVENPPTDINSKDSDNKRKGGRSVFRWPRKARRATAFSVFKSGHPLRPEKGDTEAIGAWASRVNEAFTQLPDSALRSLTERADELNASSGTDQTGFDPQSTSSVEFLHAHLE